MKKILYLILLIMMVSCASRKHVATPIVYDDNIEKEQVAFQKAKNEFLISDSAHAIMQDIGWVRHIAKEVKIKENTMPSIYRIVNDKSFTIELPCWEFDSEQFYAANVIIENKCLDSALVYAKIQGVDDIYRRSSKNEVYHHNEQKEFILDSIEYTDSYAEYMRKAQFSCLCITKTKKKYIINATLTIPK